MKIKPHLLSFVLLHICFNCFFVQEAHSQSVEKLRYKIHYGIITAGYVNFETQKTVLNEDTVYYTSLLAKTTGVVDKLYNLRDKYESYYDIKSYLPFHSVSNIKEGRYQFYDETTFFQKDLKVKSLRNDTLLTIERESFDLISALNYFRSLDWSSFAENQIVETPVFHESKFFLLPLCYQGETRLKIGGSSYKSHLFTPSFPDGKVFRSGKEQMSIWFSADNNKIPLLIKFNLNVGSYRLTLLEYENLLHPLDAKIK